MTQNERIIRHLEVYGKITPVDAMKEYGIMRLASRISDLKKQGFVISSKLTEGVNRFGETTHYSTYRLEK